MRKAIVVFFAILLLGFVAIRCADAKEGFFSKVLKGKDGGAKEKKEDAGKQAAPVKEKVKEKEKEKKEERDAGIDTEEDEGVLQPPQIPQLPQIPKPPEIPQIYRGPVIPQIPRPPEVPRLPPSPEKVPQVPRPTLPYRPIEVPKIPSVPLKSPSSVYTGVPRVERAAEDRAGAKKERKEKSGTTKEVTQEEDKKEL